MIFKTMGFRLLLRHSAKSSIAQEERLATPPAARDSSEVLCTLSQRSLSLLVGFFPSRTKPWMLPGSRHMRTLYTFSLNWGQHVVCGTPGYAWTAFFIPRWSTHVHILCVTPSSHWCPLTLLGTTRPPRPEERDGVDYQFLGVEQFLALEKSGQLIESGMYKGESRGILSQISCLIFTIVRNLIDFYLLKLFHLSPLKIDSH